MHCELNRREIKCLIAKIHRKMPEPKDTTTNEAYMGFTNRECPFYPCHTGLTRELNCLYCYCPLAFLECPGPYTLFKDKNGLLRKDCSSCILPHNGYKASWKFIQKWLEKPVPFDPDKHTDREVH